MSTSFLNVDICLKLTSYLDLSSAMALSQTCSSLYQLSLSSISYWIYTTDVHRLPVSVSQIRDTCSPDQVRYMARIVSAYNGNLRGKDFAASTSRCEFQNDGLQKLTSNNPTSFWGASSAFVQGYTPGSLPWLLTAKGSVLRCDCLDQRYDAFVEWKAKLIIDWFWRCDITSFSAHGIPEEFILVTITINDSSGNLIDVFSTAGARVRTKKLYVLKISLPLKQDFDSVRAQKKEHIMPFFHFSTYHKQSADADHELPSPKVCHISCTALPPGFVNDTCRPTSCGSKVYLMLKNKDIFPSTFSVFVYDWKQNSGVRCQLPKDVGWRKVVGFSSMMIFQDWQGPVYGMAVPELFPLSHNQTSDGPPDANPPAWHCDTEPLPLQAIHFHENLTGANWDPIDTVANATLLPLTGSIFQISDDAFYLISRLGARLCCCLYRSKRKSGGESGVEFTRVAGGFVDIGDSAGDQYVSLKTGGARSLVVALKTLEEGSKKCVSFVVIDFDIDGGYDGSDGIKTIPGVKRELRVKIASQTRSKAKPSEVLDKGNIGEVFFDGFRGTVGVVGKDYKKAILFKCTRF